VGAIVPDGAARHAGRFQFAGHFAGDDFFLAGNTLDGQEAHQAIHGRLFVER
jgi:hypothetical protein